MLIPKSLSENTWVWKAAIGGVAMVGGAALLIHHVQRQRQKALRKKWDAAGKDIVVLHQFDRAYTCPSPSPFAEKLESFLRMANIHYICDFDAPLSPKGKCPWITLNGEDISDSQICIERLSAHFGVDVDAGLSSEARAVSRALRVMLEERFVMCFALDKFVYQDVVKFGEFWGIRGLPKFVQDKIFKGFEKAVKLEGYYQGTGRHTQEEVIDFGVRDLNAVSHFLAGKKFMMGEEASLLDCVVFGVTDQILFCSLKENPFRKAVEKDMKNLVEHNLRFRQNYWNDWDTQRMPKLDRY